MGVPVAVRRPTARKHCKVADICFLSERRQRQQCQHQRHYPCIKSELHIIRRAAQEIRAVAGAAEEIRHERGHESIGTHSLGDVTCISFRARRSSP